MFETLGNRMPRICYGIDRNGFGWHGKGIAAKCLGVECSESRWHRIALQGIRNVCNVTAKTCEVGSREAKEMNRYVVLR